MVSIGEEELGVVGRGGADRGWRRPSGRHLHCPTTGTESGGGEEEGWRPSGRSSALSDRWVGL